MGKYQPFLLIIIMVTAVFSLTNFTSHETLARPSANSAPYTAHFPLVTHTESDIQFCRYGLNILQNRGIEWLETLGIGHYINFSVYENKQIPEDIPLLFQVRASQKIEDGQYLPVAEIDPPLTMAPGGLGPVVLANPGRIWIVGNEPDVPNSFQDNILPSTYAWVYRDVYRFIKNLDPTAQVANAGLSMFTPGRQQYMDIVWKTYLREFGEPMPVDIWNMHLYILSEIRPWDGGNSDGKVALGTDPALAIRAPWGSAQTECPKNNVYCRAEHDDIKIFRDQIIAFRTWMKAHGQQDKPLILSEFSLLYPFVDFDDPINPTECFLMDEYGKCFTQARVKAFMNNTFDLLESTMDPNLGYPGDEYRLVQQWTWYTTWTAGTGQSSNIMLKNYADFEPGSLDALTEVGRNFQERIAISDKRVNLVAAEASNVTVSADASGTADVPISLGFFNSGSLHIDRPVIVTFFKDAALRDVIAGIQISPEKAGIIPGCSWDHITHQTQVVWSDVPVGTHTFWVKIDPANQFPGEVSEADNVTTGTVTVKP